MASAHHGVVYTKKWVVDLIFDVAGYVSGVCKAVSFAPFRHAGLGFLVFRFLV